MIADIVVAAHPASLARGAVHSVTAAPTSSEARPQPSAATYGAGRHHRSRASQVRAELPEQRVVVQPEPRPEVRRAARTAGAGLRADLPLDHEHVAGPPH